MKKHIFSKSIQILIVGLLIALAVFRNQWAALAVTSVWLLFVFAILLLKNRRHISRWCKMQFSQPQPAESAEAPKVSTAKTIDLPDVSDPPALVALRHLNCRISDKLKSAYPDVTWSWDAEQPDWLASKGGTERITLHQAGEFTHAEVTVDQLARIEFKMMKLVDINTLLSSTQTPPAAEPVTTDATAWFDLVGRDQLTAIVTELNTRNHRKMSIAENGDVYVVEDDASVKQGALENLPGRNFWNELSELITGIGIKAQVTGDQLRLTW